MAFKTPNATPVRSAVASAPFFLRPGFLMSLGIASIAVGVIVLGLSVYEAFLSGGKIRVVDLPGFHELKLDTPGLYAGVYEHRGSGPMPVELLSKLDVRLMSKDDYQEVPVLMNTTGQTFNRLGVRGMPVFSFVIEQPGDYTLSGFTKEADDKTPSINVMILPQTAQNAKQTLFVGAACLVFFVGLGIFVLFHIKTWGPKSTNPK
jgi:hypothetical protein